MRIGELAKTAGVNVQTVRFYERIGLLHPDGRSASGYRQYGPGSVALLRGIKEAQRLGFTLAEIRRFLSSREPAPERFRTAAERKVRDLESRIDELQRLQETITRLLRACTCGGGGPCLFTAR
jgi:MerR family mercuric resistance operon transcriptional regulator